MEEKSDVSQSMKISDTVVMGDVHQHITVYGGSEDGEKNPEPIPKKKRDWSLEPSDPEKAVKTKSPA